MRTHLSSVAEENKLSDGSGNVGVCENPQAGAGAGKKPVCVKAALPLLPNIGWGRGIGRVSIFNFAWNVGENETIVNVIVEVK